MSLRRFRPAVSTCIRLVNRHGALLCLALLVCFSAANLLAQGTNAAINGQVTDPQGRVVPGAEIQAVDIDTNIVYLTKANSSGIYVLPQVPPGRYRLMVRKDGFKVINKTDITLHVQDILEQNFALEVGSVSESVTVEGGGQVINTTDASVSTVIDRQFVENMPLNGRSFQSLIELTPGVVAVQGAQVNHTGEFSVNGQRTDANNFTVDGVSANTGMAAGSGLFVGNGVTPSETALGTTQSLVSVDALQEFRIDTSTYSAEFGRSPGAQIALQTRSGTDNPHGTIFEYFRNNVLDANNWFNDAAGLAKTAERQNDFGGTFGGPVQIPRLYNGKNKTFFFFSYEGLRLAVPQPAFTTDVPDTALRQSAPTILQPILNAFPLQNGAEQGNGLALFTGTYSSPSILNAYSLRVDHSFGQKLRIFGRYSYAPSNSESRGITRDPALLENQISNVKSGTIGASSVFSPRLANEARLNYSVNTTAESYYLDNYGGAVPVTAAQVSPGVALPEGYASVVELNFGTRPNVDLVDTKTPQRQWNITDSMSYQLGAHSMKFGIDYRRLSGTNGSQTLTDEVIYTAATQVTSNTAHSGLVEEAPSVAIGVFTNFSAYAQDEWRATSRLHLSLGLRWDLNPPPTDANGPQPYTLNQIANLATAQLAPGGTPLWNTDYRGFAPRVGMALELHQSPGYQTVLRAGFGSFYDVGNFGGLYGLFGIGFLSEASYKNIPFPLTPAQYALPAPSVASPYNAPVIAFDPKLSLPYTLQWNVSVEQGLGTNQALTLSYVAALGNDLLNEQYYDPSTLNNPNFALSNGLFLTNNGAGSSYNSLQVQFQRRLSHGLQALASYTWSHAIDDLSSDDAFGLNLVRGSADFDVRHSFSGALTYDIPGKYDNHLAAGLLEHWELALRQTARSAFPVEIFSGINFLPDGQYVYTAPNLVPGAPIYLYSSTAPGHRLVNINAFVTPTGTTGNAPRNFVRAFDALQSDFALRREFPLYKELKAQFRAESFNIFNHPNFGTVDNMTTDGPALFGRATNTLNSSLGGLNPLFQLGGPRSLQLSLKVLF